MKWKPIAIAMIMLVLLSSSSLAVHAPQAIVQGTVAETLKKASSEALKANQAGSTYDIKSGQTLEASSQGADGTLLPQDQTSQSSQRSSRDLEDGWDFNNASGWSEFAYVDGNTTRLVVGINDEKPKGSAELEKLATEHQAKIVNTVSIEGQIRAVVVELSLRSVTAFVEDTRSVGLASYIEPSMKVQTQFVPNDPFWSSQWGPQKIEADWAWNTTPGDPSVLVAVVDTGIYYTHPDLSANYVPLGYDWVNNDADPLDDNGHGTHVSGTIAAVINNGVGISGLAQVRIMGEKVLDRSGSGYWEWVANGIIHAVDAGADIISMSLGGYGDSELVHEAVRYAYNSGVLVIAAAGNDNTNTKLYPAGFEEVIAVAATDQWDNKASFSNWGDWIELAAPGVNILSTTPAGYESWSGTSMATPHVSGVAALVWSQFPNKTRDWVRLWLRYTADDLGEPGFDVYYGYGRINARKAVEWNPPEHELIAYEWRPPLYVEPGASGTVNATILNFGRNDEIDVTVQLLANDTVVNYTSISLLASGNMAAVSLTWNPLLEGLYNVTMYIVPVPGETCVENNDLWRYIYVGLPVKAVVLHSAGNIDSDIIVNWQVLNAEWRQFGDTMVYIDYATLNKEDITYEDIAATGADVLIISCAFDPSMGWQFRDSEIEAIERYVFEGRGLIVTAGTFYYGVPNNNKLAPLFGLNETISWGTSWTDLLHSVNTTHPIFNDVPDPLVFPRVGSALPNDGQWDSNELVNGEYLALGHYQESALVTYRGLVYFSPWLEVIPAYYHHHLQLLYNAILWSRYQKPKHELVVSLDAPRYLQPGESALINATVSNMGLNNETNVDLSLIIDGTTVNSTTVSELPLGASYKISYLWAPSVEKMYNITTYSPPLPDEEFTFNNVASLNVRVHYVIAQVAVLNSWDIPSYFLGGWNNNYQLLVDALNAQGFYAQAVTNLDITSGILSYFDVFVMVDNVPSDAAVPYVVAFWSNGGGVVAFDSSICFLNYAGILPPESAGGNGYNVYWDYNTGSQARISVQHPITAGYTVGQIVYGTAGDAEYKVDALERTSAFPYYTMLAEDPTRPNQAYVSAYEPPTLGRAVHIWDQSQWGNTNLQRMILNAVEWTQAPRYEHDLAVTIEAPEFLAPGGSTSLNATVNNRGLSNETDVELELLINGALVDYVLIPELLSGASHTLSYSWAPVEGTYNVTAYAPPVTGENISTNNVVSKMIPVRFVTVALISDNSELLVVTTILDSMGIGYDIYNDNAMYFYTADLALLRSYRIVIFYNFDRQITIAEHSALQSYLSMGGSLIVTGYDSLGHPDDPLLADIVRSYSVGDHVGQQDLIVVDSAHAIMNGPYGSFPAGYHITGLYGDCDYAEADTTRNAKTVAELASGRDKIIATDIIPGKVVYWNGRGDYDWTQNTNSEAMFKNTIRWMQGVGLEHDLTVSLATLPYLEPRQPFILRATVRNVGLNNETDVELQLLINESMVASEMLPELPIGSSWTLNYVWIPMVEGTYNITTFAPPVPNETSTANNVISEFVSVGVMRGTVVYVSPMASVGAVNESFTINVNIFNVTDLLGYEFQLFYATSVLDGIRVETPPDHFLKPVDPTKIFIIKMEVNDNYNATHGRVWVGMMLLHPEPPKSGSGTLVTITFKATASGSSTLNLYNTKLANRDAQPIPHMTIDGFVEVVSELPHDVAIVNVVTSHTTVYVGRTINITVVAKNEGSTTETFNVTVYYDTYIIGTQSVTDLTAGENATLMFNWNTNSLLTYHNYTIIAVASVVPNEIETVDNIYIDGYVSLKMLGDIDGDAAIDIFDAVLVAAALGAGIGDPAWNPEADLYQDGIIDIFDLVIIGLHFGETA